MSVLEGQSGALPLVGSALAVPSHAEAGRAAGRVLAHPLTAAASAAVATVALRLPFRGQYLFNWDASQFALGVRHFDLAAHRPHPPGYIGYILIGRLLAWLGVAPPVSFVAISVLAEALTVGGMFWVAQRLWGRFAGWAAAALLMTSPLFWLYGGTALTYGLEPGLALLGVWLAYRSIDGTPRRLMLAAGIIGAIGALRPNTELFLLFPLGYAAIQRIRGGNGSGLRAEQRALFGALAALTGATLAWALPLVLLSGGLANYLRVSLELGSHVSKTSAIWSAGLGGTAANAGSVTEALTWSLTLYLALALMVAIAGARGWIGPVAGQAVPRRLAVIMAWWVAPSLAVYVLVHIGQLAYALFVVPALLLPAGPVLQRTAAAICGPRRAQHRHSVGIALLAACVVAQIAVFALPRHALAAQTAQRDAHVAALLNTVSRFAPADTILLADPQGLGSYQMGLYYLNNYRLYAVGRDVRGHAGVLFANDGSAPEYDLARFDTVGALRLPMTGTALVLDADVLDTIGDPKRLTPIALQPNDTIYSVALNAADPPMAFRDRIYLRGSDCPCIDPRGGRTLHPERSR